MNVYRAGEEEKAGIGVSAPIVGIVFSFIFLMWTLFCIRYVESYNVSMALFLAFAPQAAFLIAENPYLAYFATYLIQVMIAYTDAKDLLLLRWYYSLFFIILMLGIIDVAVILSPIRGLRWICTVLGAANLILLLFILIGPQVAFYALAARFPIYAILAALAYLKK